MPLPYNFNTDLTLYAFCASNTKSQTPSSRNRTSCRTFALRRNRDRTPKTEVVSSTPRPARLERTQSRLSVFTLIILVLVKTRRYPYHARSRSSWFHLKLICLWTTTSYLFCCTPHLSNLVPKFTVDAHRSVLHVGLLNIRASSTSTHPIIDV